MARKTSAMPLARFLAARNFVPLPLVRTPSGHLELVQATVNGREARLWLDTGASRTMLDLRFARDLGLALTAQARCGAGAGGGGMAVQGAVLSQLTLAGFSEPDFGCLVMDLGHVNAGLKQRGLPAIDGIVGADLLERREAVIDYKASVLYLRREFPGVA